MRRIAAAGVATLALSAGAAAFQFVDVGGRPQRWLEGRTTIFVDPAMFPDRAQAIQNASLTWSAVSGSEFRFIWGGNSPSPNVQDHANGRNDLYFDNGLPPFGYAVTYATETGEGIVERDVAFDGKLAWTTTGSGTGPDVETVALHELGHVLGLMHESSAPSIMNTSIPPTTPRRALTTDDEDGVRFLYPPGGWKPGGGGGAAGVDLAADTLSVQSGTPGPGEPVTLRLVLRNRSPSPAGPFRVKATLSPALPVSAKDEDIGSSEVPSLAGGASLEVLLDAFIPATTPPGKWRLGAFVDPENLSRDPVRTNNHAAVANFTVSRGDAEAALGDIVSGGLGPLGVDGTELWIGEGTEVSLVVRGQQGVRPVARLLPEGSSTPVATVEGKRSARIRWTAPADGTYRIEVVNALTTVGRYRILTSGVTAVRKMAIAAPAEVTFAAYAGGTVSMKAEYEGDAFLLACRPPTGPDETEPSRLRGRRASLGPLAPVQTGPHSAVLGGEGPALLWILSRTPRPGGLVVR